MRVYHNNGGPSPAWFLEEVRVRRQGGHRWTHFPCRRWLAVDQDDRWALPLPPLPLHARARAWPREQCSGGRRKWHGLAGVLLLDVRR